MNKHGQVIIYKRSYKQASEFVMQPTATFIIVEDHVLLVVTNPEGVLMKYPDGSRRFFRGDEHCEFVKSVLDDFA